MATPPLPQPSAPESSRKPARPVADAQPPFPDAAAAKPAREGTVFHLLVERGWDPELAYTADQRIRAMTSEIVAAGLQPVLAELRQMRESMVTKADLAGFATKADLAGFATKADLAGFATKADLAGFATKADLERTENNLRREIAERDVRLIKWMFGAMLAQAALIVALIVGFLTLLA